MAQNRDKRNERDQQDDLDEHTVLLLKQPLVSASAEKKRKIALGLDIRSVDKRIGFFQQSRNIFIVFRHFLQLLIDITRIYKYIFAHFMDLTRKLCKRSGLTERLSARERHACKQSILANLLQDLFSICPCPCVKVMRLRIVTAGAVVRTALRKDHISEARSINDGFRDDPTNFQRPLRA